MSQDSLPDAIERKMADRFTYRGMWIAVVVLGAWFVIGFIRSPEASWPERMIVLILLGALLLVVTVDHVFSRSTLPALDRTPHRAIVTGRTQRDTEPDSEGVCNPYELVSVRVDVDGDSLDAQIADIIDPASLDRFVEGSQWFVYAFEDRDAQGDDAWHRRVILTEQHDDVIRSGYNLTTRTLRGGLAGTGSDLLLRRFANDGR